MNNNRTLLISLAVVVGIASTIIIATSGESVLVRYMSGVVSLWLIAVLVSKARTDGSS